MYNSLLQIPLFQGISTTDLTEILEKVKIHFKKVSKGETFIREGEKCENIVFVINGSIESIFTGKNSKLIFKEKYLNTQIIEPYSLFGVQTQYTKSYCALTETDLVYIEKKYFLPQFRQYDIFNINILNLLCSRIQASNNKILLCNAYTPEEKILELFAKLSDFRSGEKVMQIKMEDLAKLIGETRLTTSKALNAMRDKNILSLKRKEIVLNEARNITGIMMENFML